MADVDRVRVNNIVGRAAQDIAALPIEEWPRWIIHILAILDPCETDSPRFDGVLSRVRDTLTARLESGQW